MSLDPSNIPIEPVEPPEAEEPVPMQPIAEISAVESAPIESAPIEEPEPTEEPPRPGFWERMRQKKRRFLGKIVSNMVGENPSHESDGGDASRAAGSIRSEIEESGLWAGIANRIKRTADDYLAQKLDEIELRIDKKLEEIDKRLSEWRDKEIANRLRIMKITLWASVIVAIISLIYAWLKVYFFSNHV
jgi:hypothetical protein